MPHYLSAKVRGPYAEVRTVHVRVSQVSAIATYHNIGVDPRATADGGTGYRLSLNRSTTEAARTGDDEHI